MTVPITHAQTRPLDVATLLKIFSQMLLTALRQARTSPEHLADGSCSSSTRYKPPNPSDQYAYPTPPPQPALHTSRIRPPPPQPRHKARQPPPPTATRRRRAPARAPPAPPTARPLLTLAAAHVAPTPNPAPVQTAPAPVSSSAVPASSSAAAACQAREEGEGRGGRAAAEGLLAVLGGLGLLDRAGGGEARGFERLLVRQVGVRHLVCNPTTTGTNDQPPFHRLFPNPSATHT